MAIEEPDLSSKFYPEPFPDGLPVIDLARISLAKLLDGNEQEAALLFEVCKDKGFCYLDLTSHDMGIKLAKQAEQVHQAAKEFYSTPVAEKRKFKTRPPETGLLDTGYLTLASPHVDVKFG
jgi:isopenicillin N synthase-like dioxygenase